MAKTARPPVIAVMGHIDHGKSSLLDYIRKTHVVADEAGGITQHVSAYIAEHNGRTATFLDTPGHEAFKALRARGASAADIAILVIAADEGVMPQTVGSLNAIKESDIPYIIAITKIDKNNADIERTKHSILEHEMYLEGLGGTIAYVPISSKTGEGISELLDLVLLTADLADLTADPDISATGFVLESTMDPKHGTSATLIIKNGTLVTGNFVVTNNAYAPVRFIEDFAGTRIKSAGPSVPVHISGFNSLPEAGALFSVVPVKKEAEKLACECARTHPATPQAKPQVNGIKEIPLIVKADVAGSVDAIVHELAKITHERSAIHIIASGVGNISENDVKTASASNATIIGFNVEIDATARTLAERDNVIIELFTIIYKLTKRVSEILLAGTPSIEIEQELGRAKVLKIFSTSTKKQVLGAQLLSGTFVVGNIIKIIRKEEEIARGSIENLQQTRTNVKEINTEGEFGMEILLKEGSLPGDTLIAFTMIQS